MTIIIGIPSRLLNKNIDNETFNQVKEVQKIITLNIEKLKKSQYYSETPNLIDEYGFIYTIEQVDKLFEELTIDEKEKIKALLISKKIKRISIKPKCMQFLINVSKNNIFINSSSESLWLIYNDTCNCACEEKVEGNNSEKVKAIDKGWFKVLVIDKREIPKG